MSELTPPQSRLKKRPMSPQCIISVPPPSSPAPDPEEQTSNLIPRNTNRESKMEPGLQTKSGYLYKMYPGKKKKGKKKKFYVATITQQKTQIFCYTSEEACFQAVRPKKSYSISDPVRTVIIDRMFFSGEKYSNTFSIVSTDCSLHLAALSDEERLDWLLFLSKAIFPTNKLISSLLLPDELILQQIRHCTFSATGKQMPLYTSHTPVTSPSTFFFGEGEASAGLTKALTKSAQDSFIRTSRSRVQCSVGEQDSVQQTTDFRAQVHLKMTSKPKQVEVKVLEVQHLLVTSFRLFIQYKSTIINDKQRPDKDKNRTPSEDKMSSMSLALDSFHKIFLQTENTFRSSPQGQAYESSESERAKMRPTSIHAAFLAHQVMTIHCRDFRTILLGFDFQKKPDHATSVKLLMELLTHKMAFRCHSASFMSRICCSLLPENNETTIDDTNAVRNSFTTKFYFNASVERNRQNISPDLWKETHELSLCHRDECTLSPKRLLYHKPLLVPSSLNDSTIHKASLLRLGGLFPVLNWKHPKEDGGHIFTCLRRGNTIFRKSDRLGTVIHVAKNPLTSTQNAISPPTKSNTLGNQTINLESYIAADQSLISTLVSVCSPSQLQLINLINKDLSDHHPMLFVEEINYLEGIDCSLNNIILPVQRDILDSFQRLYEMVCGKNAIPPTETSITIMEQIESTQWMQYNNQFLNTAFDILQVVENGQSILVQAERSEYYSLVVIVTLVQLLSDPYYRTLSGFCVLLQKEWFSNVTHHEDSTVTSLQKKLQEGDGYSVPFIQFLDIVWQILELFPRSFEFNHKFLFFVADNLNCGTLYFRLSLYFGSNYQLGHNIYSNKSAGNSFRKDPGVAPCFHPLLFPVTDHGEEPRSSFASEGLFWDLIAKYRHEFSNSLFVKNTKLRHSILSNSSTFQLNCWFPYYMRYFHWQSTLKFYKEFERIQQTAGRNKTSIDLRGLGLSLIPLEAEHLIHLRDINFSYNTLTSVPQFLSILPNLGVLNLEGNYISSLFEDKMMLPDTIVVLNLNYNRVRTFPSSIKKLTKLKELHIAGNQISRIKSGIKHLRNLLVLDVSNNFLTVLPDVFDHLTNIQVLCVQHNQLKSIPESLQTLSQLRHFNISTNRLQNTSALQQIKNACRNIKKLNLSYNNKFDSSFYFQMDSLTELYLRGLSLHQLPKNMSQLTELTVLDLQENLFSQFPEEIISLVHLKKLNFKDNKLQELSLQLGALSKLSFLNLMSNQLHSLDLYPIGALRSLKKLDISQNPSIQDTFLKPDTLLANVSQYHSLQKLRIYGKKWLQGSALQQFLKHQRELSLEEMEFCYLPHLVIVGPESVGKSSLVKWLISRFVHDPSNTKSKQVQFDFIAPTQGMETKHEFSVWHNNHHRLHKSFISVWDFSGNSKFFPIQESFIGCTGFFIVTFNWKKRFTQSSQIIEWLRLIACRNENAQVLLVGTYDQITAAEYTKGVQHDRNIFLQSMKAVYRNIEGIFLINISAKALRKASSLPSILRKLSSKRATEENLSAATGSDSPPQKRIHLSQLLELENHFISKLIRTTVPASFMDYYSIIHNVYKKRTIPAITHGEVFLIASLCNILVQDRKKFLHALLGSGILMERSAINSAVASLGNNLCTRTFFDPQWFANLLISLHPSDLDNYTLPCGILTTASLEYCWRPPQFPAKLQKQYFQILQDTGALFLLPEDSSESFGKCKYILGRNRDSTFANASAIAVVPSKFTPKKPTELIDKEINDRICTKITYLLLEPFSPPGLISRMMVSLFETIIPLLVWKDGILFSWDNSYILLEFIHPKNVDSYEQDTLPSCIHEKKGVVLFKISKFATADEIFLPNTKEKTVENLIEDCFLKVTFCYYNNLQLSVVPDSHDNQNSQKEKESNMAEENHNTVEEVTKVSQLGRHRSIPPPSSP